jgi:cell division protein FtsI (penicillin-binding protein 3)
MMKFSRLHDIKRAGSKLIAGIKAMGRFLVCCLRNYLHAVQPQRAENPPPLSSRLRMGILLRFALLAVTMFVVFSLLWRHVYCLQISRHVEFDEKALKVYRSYGSLPAQRGRIFDVSGNILACDLATYDILAEPKRFIRFLPEVLELSEQYLGLDRRELMPRLTQALRYKSPCLAIEEIDAQLARELQAENLPGVKILPSTEGAAGSFQVLFYPQGITNKQCQEIIATLERFSEDCAQTLPAKIESALNRQREIPLKFNAPMDSAKKFIAAVKRHRIHGIRAVETCQRSYPRDRHLANMLGYLDSERVGISGIEGMFNDIMKPVSGKIEIRRDRLGRPVEDGIVVISPPTNGADVFLTICEPLQQIVEEEMLPLIEQFSPDHAYALMMNPATGAVLAAAQFPQFNPNDRSTMRTEVLPNHALYKCYEPGSIMKGISVSCALENRIVRLNSMYYCEQGHWRYGGRTLRDTHNYAEMTVAQIIQKSSNIGVAKIALDMGEEMLYKGLASFAFGKPTGLGFYPEDHPPRFFPNESPGLFKNLKSWDTLTVTRMPIGQGISATPWQILQAWSALANGGVMMQPYIVDRIAYPDGKVVYSVPRVKGVPLSRETAALITEALKMVIEKGGTGTRAAVEGYSVAGKTGTAQMWVNGDRQKKIKGHYSNSKHFASFVGFAPAENPAFILLISAEYPKGPFRTGGVVCAPAFKRIAKRTLEYLQIPPSIPLEEEQARKPAGSVAKR